MKRVSLLGAVILLTATLASASNMGFKLSYPLAPPAAGVHDGSNWVAMPYFASPTDALQLKTDMGATCTEVNRWNPATSTFDKYTGGPGSVNFAVVAGEAYMSKVNASTTWVVVGSHNPALAVAMSLPNAGVHDGNNWVAVPYHTTATDALSLKSQMGVTCTEVNRWNPATSTFDKYTGGPGSVNFTLTPGEGYMAKVNVSTNWQPAHY